MWQSSKGETNSAIGHALPQPHPSSSELRSSVGSVGWPPQWAPSFLAQMPSPPPSVPQRSFSLSPNKPPQQPSRVAGDSWMVVAATNKSTCKCCYFQTCHLGVMQPASSTHTMAAHVLMRPPGNNQTRRRALTRPCVGDHRPAEVLHPVQLPRRLTTTGGLTSTTRVEPPRIQEVSSGSSASALHNTGGPKGWRVGRGWFAPRL